MTLKINQSVSKDAQSRTLLKELLKVHQIHQAVKEKASYITPVPGGVGPLTVQFLMEAVVKLTRRQNGRK